MTEEENALPFFQKFSWPKIFKKIKIPAVVFSTITALFFSFSPAHAAQEKTNTSSEVTSTQKTTPVKIEQKSKKKKPVKQAKIKQAPKAKKPNLALIAKAKIKQEPKKKPNLALIEKAKIKQAPKTEKPKSIKGAYCAQNSAKIHIAPLSVASSLDEELAPLPDYTLAWKFIKKSAAHNISPILAPVLEKTPAMLAALKAPVPVAAVVAKEETKPSQIIGVSKEILRQPATAIGWTPALYAAESFTLYQINKKQETKPSAPSIVVGISKEVPAQPATVIGWTPALYAADSFTLYKLQKLAADKTPAPTKIAAAAPKPVVVPKALRDTLSPKLFTQLSPETKKLAFKIKDSLDDPHGENKVEVNRFYAKVQYDLSMAKNSNSPESQKAQYALAKKGAEYAIASGLAITYEGRSNLTNYGMELVKQDKVFAAAVLADTLRRLELIHPVNHESANQWSSKTWHETAPKLTDEEFKRANHEADRIAAYLALDRERLKEQIKIYKKMCWEARMTYKADGTPEMSEEEYQQCKAIKVVEHPKPEQPSPPPRRHASVGRSSPAI